MKYRTSVSLILCLFTAFACVDKDQQHQKKTKAEIRIGYRDMPDDLPGSLYKTRARSYFTVWGTDTSSFSCTFSAAKADSSVTMRIAFQKDLTYDQQLEDLKALLPEAARDFDMSRLKDIGIGRLVTSGDLAVRITQQYRERFGANTSIGSYNKVALFLKQSPLGVDMNRLLHPYGHSVDHVSVEKVFFTDRQVLYQYSTLTTDTAAIPQQVLDCMTWVSVVPE